MKSSHVTITNESRYSWAHIHTLQFGRENIIL